MALFTPFRKATRPETPGFMHAAIEEGNFKQRAKQQENALRSQNILGAASLYNAGMGERSPIADYLFKSEPAATGVSAPVAGNTPAAVSAPGSSTPALAGTGGATTVPLSTTGAGAAGAAGAGTTAGAGAAGAGAAGSGTTGALASMGPYGWAALAAMALLSMG